MTDIRKDLLRQFNGRKCAVTGGEGFVGSRLCDVLEEAGAEVTSFDVKPSKKARNKQLDIAIQPSALDQYFQKLRPEYIFHLAALTEVRSSFSQCHRYYANNINSTLSVLEACTRVRPVRLVVASTDKVYGTGGPPFVEGDGSLHDRCTDPYSASKKAADLIVQDWAPIYKIPCRILRCVNTYGPGQMNRSTLITQTCLRFLRGEPPVSFNPQAKREWLYVDDAVNAYLLSALDAELRGSLEVFNVGSRHIQTNEWIIEAIRVTMEGILQKPLPKNVLVGETFGAENLEVPFQWVDSFKFRQQFSQWDNVLGNVGIHHTVKWYVDHFQNGDFVHGD